MTEFSKEQIRQSTSTVYHKHYSYRTFFSRFTVRLLSKSVRTIAPEENSAPVRVRFWFRISVKIRVGAIFLRNNCSRTFSKVVVISRNYNHGSVVNFKFNFTFHNTLIYNRVTFSNRVACCVDLIRESWQPIEASFKDFRKIGVPKIPTNRKTANCVCKNLGKYL